MSDTPATPPDRETYGGLSEDATQSQAVVAGLLGCFSVPALILLSSAAGFGALARDAGFTLYNAIFMMVTFFALPAQFVIADQLARGASIWAGAFSVLLTAVRMLPMVVTLMPYLREGQGGRVRQIIAVHPMAVTSWIEGMRRLPLLPPHLRVSYFLGFGYGLVTAATTGAIIGYVISGSVPIIVSAVLLFLTPVYFLLSSFKTATSESDWAAIALGCALGPSFYVLMPEFDLLLASLVGGTAAYAFGRMRVFDLDDPEHSA